MAAASLFDSLCIRADAGTKMGVGHVMRCLALAQAWQAQGGVVTLVSRELPPQLSARWEKEGFTVRGLRSDPGSAADVEETTLVALAAGASWLVLDGYHFGPEYRAEVRRARLKLLVVDDLETRDLSAANAVLNQNLNAHERMYPEASSESVLLLGSRYTLLRNEFLAGLPRPRQGRCPARRILLTFGGGDAANVTQRMAELITQIIPDRLHLTLVIGATNPHVASLQANLFAWQRRHDVELLVNPPNLPEIMNQADLAISAAGSTCWELASLGVPMLVVVTAPPQEPIARRMHESGLAILLGNATEALGAAGARQISQLVADADVLGRLSATARGYIDGHGSRRVVETLAAFPLRLRPARPTDVKRIWDWANDPATRLASFNTTPIPWEAHQAWFAHLLADPATHAAYLAEDAVGRAVGFARFTREGAAAEVSLNLAPVVRGRGWGAKLVRLGAFQATAAGFCSAVRGWVKTSNPASLAAFRRAGFSESAPMLHRGTEAIEFCWPALDSGGIPAFSHRTLSP